MWNTGVMDAPLMSGFDCSPQLPCGSSWDDRHHSRSLPAKPPFLWTGDHMGKVTSKNDVYTDFPTAWYVTHTPLWAPSDFRVLSSWPITAPPCGRWTMTPACRSLYKAISKPPDWIYIGIRSLLALGLLSACGQIEYPFSDNWKEKEAKT